MYMTKNVYFEEKKLNREKVINSGLYILTFNNTVRYAQFMRKTVYDIA